jgi:hypothetical protein
MKQNHTSRPSFGIPELDALLRPANLKSQTDTAMAGELHYFVACIEGSAGSGKSTLALHCAAQHAKMGATVVYISTDWSFSQALGLWNSYKLGHPAGDRNQQTHRYAGPDAHSGPNDHAIPNHEVEIRPLTSRIGKPMGSAAGPLPKSAAELIGDRASGLGGEERQAGVVYFLDLSREDLGDEWSFTERLLGSLKRRRDPAFGSEQDDLVVVDSLPGLEVLSGQIDSYGSQVGTEVHLSRLIRLASESGMNLLYTAGSEEPAGRNMRAEAQADFVYQLAADACYGTPKRQLQIVKARGYSHLLAPSIIEFRSDKPTFSSGKEDLDHGSTQNFYAYLYPSLGSLLDSIKERQFRVVDIPEPSENRAVCATGIQFLDNLLVRAASSERSTEKQPTSSLADRFGVPTGTALSVVGDQHTHKSAIGMAFARYTFTRVGRRVFGLLQVPIDGEVLEGDFLSALPLRSIDSWHRYRLECLTGDDFDISIKAEVESNSEKFEEALRARTGKGGAALQESDGSYRLGLKKIVRKLWDNIDVVETFCEAMDKEFPQLEVNVGGGLSDAEEVVISRIRRVLRLSFMIASRPRISRRALLVTTRFVMLQEFAQEAAHYMAMRFAPQISGILELLRQKFKLNGSIRRELEARFNADFIRYYNHIIFESLDYRRLVGADVVPSILFDIVRRYSFEILSRMQIKAQRPRRPSQPEFERFEWLDPILPEESVRLRIVVDDLQAVREAAVRASRGEEFEDFLSTLTTFLRSRNLTCCLIESNSSGSDMGGLGPLGRPEKVISVNLAKVRFKSGSRVAISVDPAVQDDYHGVVRELKLVEMNSTFVPHPRIRLPFVDPDFELYENLGTGDPKIVGLKVMLYRETKGWEKYYSEVNSFLGRVVTSNVEPKDPEVVFPIEPKDYITLQDLATFQNSADLPCTLVLQVDGYWALRREGDLRDLTHYLRRQLDSGFEFERAKEDQFFAYVARVSSVLDKQRVLVGPGDAKSRLEQYRLDSRADRNGVIYSPHFPRSDDGDRWDDFIDRVPFTWDFGFLLVEDTFKGDPAFSKMFNGDRGIGGVAKGAFSWQDFLDACSACSASRSAALGEALIPFRLGADFPETMDSVVLEMMFSDLQSSGYLEAGIMELLSGSQMRRDLVESNVFLQDGLISLLRLRDSREESEKGFSREARKALMRSVRMLAKAMLPRRGHKLLDPKDCKSLRYIAARHWYKTAASETNPDLGGNSSGRRYTVFPLPGRFSTRGDWYLGIAKGSRSIRLGELAIDALTDIEQNVRRLRLGIGLPVRDIFSRSESHLRGHSVATAIQEWDKQGIRRMLGMEAFFEKAAGQAWDTAKDVRVDSSDNSKRRLDSEGVWWLWRSALGGYDWQAEPFRNWLRDSVEGIQAEELAAADPRSSGGGGDSQEHGGAVEEPNLDSEDDRIETLLGILRAVTPARQGSVVL